MIPYPGPPSGKPTIGDLSMDQLLKLLEIIKKVDGSATGDHIHSVAYKEFQQRIGFSSEEVPKREMININTSRI